MSSPNACQICWTAEEQHYAQNDYHGPAAGDLLRFEDAARPLLLVASHAVNHYRSDGSLKPADIYTGGLVHWLGRQLGCQSLSRQRTATAEHTHPCQQLIATLPESTVILDIHGARNPADDWDLAIGTGTITDAAKLRLLDRTLQAAASAGIRTVINHPGYAARHPCSLTNRCTASGHHHILQLEFTKRLRTPEEPGNAHRLLQFFATLS